MNLEISHSRYYLSLITCIVKILSKKKYRYMWKERKFKKRENWFRDKGVIYYVILHFARHQYQRSILLTRRWVANSKLEKVKTLIKSELMKTTFTVYIQDVSKLNNQISSIPWSKIRKKCYILWLKKRKSVIYKHRFGNVLLKLLKRNIKCE